jgi:hypothetical protein
MKKSKHIKWWRSLSEMMEYDYKLYNTLGRVG